MLEIDDRGTFLDGSDVIARRNYRLHNMDQGGRCRTSSELLDAVKV
ncbi:hypothetical protein [Hungatella sp.]|nr:hypothetical protein [Hungatella sp.]